MPPADLSGRGIKIYIRDLLTCSTCTRRLVSYNSAHFPPSTTLANETESLRIPTRSLCYLSNQVINWDKQVINISPAHFGVHDYKISLAEILYQAYAITYSFLRRELLLGCCLATKTAKIFKLIISKLPFHKINLWKQQDCKIYIFKYNTYIRKMYVSSHLRNYHFVA